MLLLNNLPHSIYIFLVSSNPNEKGWNPRRSIGRILPKDSLDVKDLTHGDMIQICGDPMGKSFVHDPVSITGPPAGAIIASMSIGDMIADDDGDVNIKSMSGDITGINLRNYLYYPVKIYFTPKSERLGDMPDRRFVAYLDGNIPYPQTKNSRGFVKQDFVPLHGNRAYFDNDNDGINRNDEFLATAQIGDKEVHLGRIVINSKFTRNIRVGVVTPRPYVPRPAPSTFQL